jgi:DNA-binding LacI/PurR family transcriptional regulator
MVSILEVAKEAGVSTATVSRTFSTPGLLREETCAKVLETANRLNYRPRRSRSNKAAPDAGTSAQKPKKADTIGFQFFGQDESDLVGSNGFYGPVLAGAQSEAAKAGMHLMMHATHRYELLERLPKMVEEKSVAGLLLVGTADPKVLKTFAEHVPHIVLVDNVDETGRFDCVIPDGFRGMYRATRHLIELGHTNIGFYVDSSPSTTFKDRLHGYVCAHIDAGLTPGPQLVVPEDRSAHVSVICEYLSARRRPTAMIAASDWLALDLVKACGQIGLKIPQDLSIVGYDDIEISAMTDPALTTVRVEKELLGRLAVRRLLHHIERESHHLSRGHANQAGSRRNELPIHITVPVSLIPRQSCRAVGKRP